MRVKGLKKVMTCLFSGSKLRIPFISILSTVLIFPFLLLLLLRLYFTYPPYFFAVRSSSVAGDTLTLGLRLSLRALSLSLCSFFTARKMEKWRKGGTRSIYRTYFIKPRAGPRRRLRLLRPNGNTYQEVFYKPLHTLYTSPVYVNCLKYPPSYSSSFLLLLFFFFSSS